MKDSPLFLLVPTVLIIGVVGWMFLESGKSSTETLETTSATATTTSETVSTTSEQVQIEKKSTSENPIDVFKPKAEDEKWSDRNLLMREPCDFAEVEKFADNLLARPEWAEVVKQYPNRTDTEYKESNLYAIGASKWLHTCYLEVKLKTNELSREEANALSYEEVIKVWDILPMINNQEDYDDGFASATLEDISFTFLPADGPSGSSYGAYQYGENLKTVRLFGVSHGSMARMSVYQAEELGEDPCPCSKSVRLLITNPISAEDVRKALEKAELPQNLEE